MADHRRVVVFGSPSDLLTISTTVLRASGPAGRMGLVMVGAVSSDWHRAPGEEEDFIPTWRTEAEALAVVKRLGAAGVDQRFTFEVVDIRIGIEAGGP